jgi:hypothetical protein
MLTALTSLGVTLSVIGVLEFLLFLAVIVLLIVGVKYLLGLAGVTVPQPIWVVLGVILFLVLVIWMLGGGTGINLR